MPASNNKNRGGIENLIKSEQDFFDFYKDNEIIKTLVLYRFEDGLI